MAPRAPPARGRVVTQLTVGPRHTRVASRPRRDVEHAGAAGSIRIVIQRPEWATAAGFGAPLLDLERHDPRGIEVLTGGRSVVPARRPPWEVACDRSEEHTSELQSRPHL